MPGASTRSLGPSRQDRVTPKLQRQSLPFVFETTKSRQPACEMSVSSAPPAIVGTSMKYVILRSRNVGNAIDELSKSPVFFCLVIVSAVAKELVAFVGMSCQNAYKRYAVSAAGKGINGTGGSARLTHARSWCGYIYSCSCLARSGIALPNSNIRITYHQLPMSPPPLLPRRYSQAPRAPRRP